MELGYSMPVRYEQTRFAPVLGQGQVCIKQEPGLDNYPINDNYSNISCQHLDEPKRFFLKDKSVLSECELSSWINTHPKHWTKKEVLDWIFSVVETDQLDGSRVQGEAYRDLTGQTLYQMSREDFESVDPLYGRRMYETFRNLVKNINFEKPVHVTGDQSLDNFNQINSDANNNISKDISERIFGRSSCAHRSEGVDSDGLRVIQTGNDVTVEIPSMGLYSISPDIEFPFSSKSLSFMTPPSPCSSHHPSSLNSSLTSSMSSHHPTDSAFRHSYRTSPLNIPLSVQSPPPRSPSSSSYHHIIDDRDSGCSSDDSMTRPPNFMTSSLMDMDESSRLSPDLCDVMVSSSRGLKKGRHNATKNGNHLWEFVRDLLRDPKTNPKLLKWEDHENGVFRFVQSEAVARLWGEKKNNPLMTYEKLSRAMRFCRTAGYFETVPKNGKFPKKLCFMFGSRAHGWKD